MSHAVANHQGVRADALPTFDFHAFTTALDEARRSRGLNWYELADELWEQSAVLNAELGDHPLCGGAVGRLVNRNDTSCQYAMSMLRWLDRAPEDFLEGAVIPVGDTRLPSAGPDRRLRWDLPKLHRALNARRVDAGLTWSGLGTIIGCTPTRLTNLRTARQADLDLTMRLCQWLARPAADFIEPARW